MKREYICDIANELQEAFKKTYLQVEGIPTEVQKDQMMKDRVKPEYQTARDALIEHLSLCPECAYLRQPYQSPKDEPAWAKWLKFLPVEADDYTDI